MTMSAAEYDARFGTAWHASGEAIKQSLIYTVYAGDPTNNVVPAFIGQHCLDTANAAFYIATSTASSGWKKLTP